MKNKVKIKTNWALLVQLVVVVATLAMTTTIVAKVAIHVANIEVECQMDGSFCD